MRCNVEIKEGMYIRFIRGNVTYIRKIKSHYKKTIKSKNMLIVDVSFNGCTWSISEDKILNASYEVVELIKVGDYVNGIKVTSVNKTVDGNILIGLGEMFGFTKFDNDYTIKTIVTKEEFESMEYEV